MVNPGKSRRDAHLADLNVSRAAGKRPALDSDPESEHEDDDGCPHTARRAHIKQDVFCHLALPLAPHSSLTAHRRARVRAASPSARRPRPR